MIVPDFKSYVVWDLETSSLSSVTGSVLEIGAMIVDGGDVVAKRSWLLNHGIDISEETTKITGIRRDDIDREGVDPMTACRDFMQMLDICGFANVTHNGFRFDIGFFLAELARISDLSVGKINELGKKIRANAFDTAIGYKACAMGIDQMWNERFEDFAQRILGIRAMGVKYNVQACCENMGISMDGIQRHRALGDVALTNEIYKGLLQKSRMKNI